MTVAVVDFTIYLTDAEALLPSEERLEDLVAVLVEDVAAGAYNVELGEQSQRHQVVLALPQVFLQKVHILANRLHHPILTILNWL